ncbi:MAG: hypothetical protein KAG26_09185, partial [Methylococcales bacterium]|nr:hypothetical protein [Methylococcales bacterium]
MNRIKLFAIYLTLGGLLAFNAEAQKLPFGKKDDANDDPKEEATEEESGGFGGKLKAKAKNFNVMKSLGKLAGNLL